MNFGRGLFRAWIVLSALWIIGAGTVGYFMIDTVRGNYQPSDVMKERVGAFPPYKPDQKTFYEVYRSPSAEGLTIKFFHLDWHDTMNKDDYFSIAEMAD